LFGHLRAREHEKCGTGQGRAIAHNKGQAEGSKKTKNHSLNWGPLLHERRKKRDSPCLPMAGTGGERIWGRGENERKGA